jgi:hypothetical protein
MEETLKQLTEIDKKYLSEIAQLAIENAVNLKLIRNNTIESIIFQAGYKSVNDFVNELKTAKLTLPPPLSTHYGNFTKDLVPFISAALACNDNTTLLLLNYLAERQFIEQVGEKYRYRL